MQIGKVTQMKISFLNYKVFISLLVQVSSNIAPCQLLKTEWLTLKKEHK